MLEHIFSSEIIGTTYWSNLIFFNTKHFINIIYKGILKEKHYFYCKIGYKNG